MAVSEDVLRQNAHALPQMRFLLDDQAILQLTAQVIFTKARLGTTSTTDNSKLIQIKRFVSQFLSSFFGINIASLPEKAVPHLSDDDTEILAAEANTYYVAKLTKNYAFTNDMQIVSPIPEFEQQSPKPTEDPIQLQKASSTVTADDFKTALLVPPFKPGYSIMFGTLDFFVFLKRFVMVYERFAIAKRQVADKIAEDLGSDKIIDQVAKETNLPRE